VDPDLHLDQLEQVQHDVAALLEHGLNPPAVPDAAPPPAAAEVALPAEALASETSSSTDPSPGVAQTAAG
jgi:hypothetical protein